MFSSSVTDSLNLIFDADDTLWDSNIHFLEAFDSFAVAVENSGLGLSRIKIQDAVRRAELHLIKSLGYGRRPYVMALHHAAVELAPSDAGLRDEIERIGVCLIDRECALLPDVEPTLRELAKRHRLLMFTKGQRDEQLQKLARSGLAPLFDRVETPREKDVDAYLRLVSRCGTQTVIHLHDWKQSSIGYQSRGESRIARRLHTASAHLGT